MMAAVGGQGIPVAPLVLDDAESLEVMAAAVMRLHSLDYHFHCNSLRTQRNALR